MSTTPTTPRPAAVTVAATLILLVGGALGTAGALSNISDGIHAAGVIAMAVGAVIIADAIAITAGSRWAHIAGIGLSTLIGVGTLIGAFSAAGIGSLITAILVVAACAASTGLLIRHWSWFRGRAPGG